jgi:hypothetical protein
MVSKKDYYIVELNKFGGSQMYEEIDVHKDLVDFVGELQNNFVNITKYDAYYLIKRLEIEMWFFIRSEYDYKYKLPYCRYGINNEEVTN